MRLTATNALVAINTLIYIAELASPKIVIYGALVPALVFERPWTLITYAFLHANFLHLFFNMIFLRVLGNRLEAVIGQEAFIIAYLTIAFLVGIIHAILCLTILTPYAYVPTIGASGAVMGVLGMSVVHIGDLRLRIILFPIPIPLELTVRNLAILIFVTETFMALLNIEPGIAHDAHIAGLILGYFMARFSKPSLSIPRLQKKGFSLELLRGKERPKYVREFTLYDEMDIACIRRLSYHLYRLLNGKPVNVNEVLADITQCDPEALELFVVSTLTSLSSPTQRTLIGMLLVSILKILVRAYDEGVIDVSFRKLRVFRYMEDPLDYIYVRRRGAERLWSRILSEKSTPSRSKIREEWKEKYGIDPSEVFAISVTRLTKCPYYDILVSEEYGSHYYFRGKLFEDALIDYLTKEGFEVKERQKHLFTLIELGEELKGFDKAIVYGFVDAIMERGGKKYIVETKSTFVGKPRIITRLTQLAIYVRLYRRLFGEDVQGLLLAYIEGWDPPLGMWLVEVKKEMLEFVKNRVKAYLKHERSPLDTSLCEVCPVRERCPFRTGSPCRASSKA